MKPSEMGDSRIVYGVNCLWWDNVDKAITLPPPGHVPGCPHCGSLLLQVPDEETWFKAVDEYEQNGHPGYRAYVEWRKGKCFKSALQAKLAYEKETGVQLQF